jgi:2-C-methyl-D-erythritol 4-phosphate cytidylyltransferase
MIENARVGAIVPAAGRGVRMGGNTRKQFFELDGRAILLRTLDIFQSSDEVDLIVLAADPGDRDTATDLLRDGGISKCRHIAPGGPQRQDSVRNALELLAGESVDLVIVHDAVRPFVRQSLLHRVLVSALQTGAAVAAVPPKETMKRSRLGQIIDETLPRNQLWVAQTPQVFQYSILQQAYEKALEDQFSGTDDAELAERLGVKITIVEGDYDNIKITTPEDIPLAESILRRTSPIDLNH